MGAEAQSGELSAKTRTAQPLCRLPVRWWLADSLAIQGVLWERTNPQVLN